WVLCLGLYLTLATHMMLTSGIERMRQRASSEDEGQMMILGLTSLAALASLAAIFAELGTGRKPLQVTLAAATILLSWAFIHTIYALHYAHEFYDDESGGGLAFPGADVTPDYWDFVYFS